MIFKTRHALFYIMYYAISVYICIAIQSIFGNLGLLNFFTVYLSAFVSCGLFFAVVYLFFRDSVNRTLGKIKPEECDASLENIKRGMIAKLSVVCIIYMIPLFSLGRNLDKNSVIDRLASYLINFYSIPYSIIIPLRGHVPYILFWFIIVILQIAIFAVAGYFSFRGYRFSIEIYANSKVCSSSISNASVKNDNPYARIPHKNYLDD